MSSQATESSRSIEFQAWVESNRKPLIIAGVAIVIIACAVSLYRMRQRAVESSASAALLQVQTPADRSAGAAPKAEAFMQVVDDFPGTAAASRALLFAANALFTGGQYAESAAQFDRFLSDYPGSSLAATAAYGKAVCLDAQGRTNDAMTAYRSVIGQYPNAAEADEARYALAGLHEAQSEMDEALRLYDELAGSSAGTALAGKADTRKEQLLLEHPELAPPVTNTIPSSADSQGLLDEEQATQLETIVSNAVQLPIE